MPCSTLFAGGVDLVQHCVVVEGFLLSDGDRLVLPEEIGPVTQTNMAGGTCSINGTLGESRIEMVAIPAGSGTPAASLEAACAPARWAEDRASPQLGRGVDSALAYLGKGQTCSAPSRPSPLPTWRRGGEGRCVASTADPAG